MRIVFIGAVEFSLSALEKILSLDGNVVGVCTLKSSTFNSDFVDLTSFAGSRNIPTIYVEDINSSKSVKWISNLNPDVIFCFGWSRLLRPCILNLAPLVLLDSIPPPCPPIEGVIR